MNKRIIVLIALVAAVSVVPASAETLEIRGTVQNLAGAQTVPIEWNAVTFTGMFYDLDKGLYTESLTIKAGTLNGCMDRTIDKNSLTYRTHPIWREYELYKAEGLTVESDNTGGDKGYWIEGWMAEKYIAIGGSDTISGNAKKLSKLLVEFDTDDKKTLATGEEWDLSGGFVLTAKQIIDADAVEFSLSKHGLELDNKSVSAGEVYTYLENVAGEENVPIFSCYVDGVFKGSTSYVQLMYVFLIDNVVCEIKSGDLYGVMEVMTASSAQIILENDDSRIDLSTKAKEHIMGDMYFKVADDYDYVRFYPMVEYTEPGTYEVRGTVLNLSAAQATALDWNATTFAGFYYNLDADLHTESLTIKANTLDGGAVKDRSIDKNSLTYRTCPIWREYKLNKSTGLTVDSDNTGGDRGYWIEGWMAEKYIAIGGSDASSGNAKKLSKLLVEFDTDDKKTLFTGEEWDLGGGFILELLDIADTGYKATLQLSKNGVPLDLTCIDTSKPDNRERVYTYNVDVAGEKKIPVFSCYVDYVFKGSTSYVQLKYVFLIDNDILEIKSGDTYGVMEAKTVSNTQIILENDDSSIELSTKAKEHIMGDMYFKTADDAATIRLYPFVERTIGGVAPTPPPDTIPATDTDCDGVPDVWDMDNSTPAGYWVNPQGIGRMWGDMNGDGWLTSVDALMILQAAAGKIGL